MAHVTPIGFALVNGEWTRVPQMNTAEILADKLSALHRLKLINPAEMGEDWVLDEAHKLSRQIFGQSLTDRLFHSHGDFHGDFLDAYYEQHKQGAK